MVRRKCKDDSIKVWRAEEKEESNKMNFIRNSDSLWERVWTQVKSFVLCSGI